MKRRSLMLAAVLGPLVAAGACSSGKDVERARPGGAATALPSPDVGTGVTFAAALARRRSRREYDDRPLTRAESSQLMWAAQGITSDGGLRTAPSAGAIYPLTIGVALPDGLYRYAAKGHLVDRVFDQDVRVALGKAALGQQWVGRAPAIFTVTGDVSRSAAKYGTRAERYVFLEAGHTAQNLLLQAAALGLAGVPVGAFDDDEVRRLLQLPTREQPIYLIPVGQPIAA